jgi:hypothetical protein
MNVLLVYGGPALKQKSRNLDEPDFAMTLVKHKLLVGVRLSILVVSGDVKSLLFIVHNVHG